MNPLHEDCRILFDGDSITDCNRDRTDRHSLAGYARLIQTYFTEFVPERKIECFNRGVSGDRTKDLLARIDADIADTAPDIISILIGINDTWRRYDSGDETTAAAFERNLSGILDRCKKGCKRLVLLEPFLMRADPAKAEFRADLDPKIQVCRTLARSYGAVYVPLDGMFAALEAKYGYGVLSEDGVHPSPRGHAAIARAWLAAMDCNVF